MKSDPKQHGCNDNWDFTSLINEGFVNRFLKVHYLGNYTREIYHEILCRLEVDKRSGRKISMQVAFGHLRNIARSEIRRKVLRRNFEKSLADTIKNGSNNSNTTCPADIAANAELIKKLQNIIDELPDKQKIVLRMRFFLSHKPTFKKIGHVIKKSETSARDYYHNALEFIRQRLDAIGATEKELYEVTNSAMKPQNKATYLKGE